MAEAGNLREGTEDGTGSLPRRPSRAVRAGIRFGALGAARITPAALLEPARRHPGVEVRAIASRSRRRARSMAAKGGVREVLGDYREVVEHPEVDAIYIALPNSHHREWTLRALAAGKAVLCEKPFAANEREAKEMAEAAGRAGLLLVEAFHHRYHPVFERALEICRSGAIGDLRRLSGVFHGPVRSRRRFRRNLRLDYATGGGATMDRGCYPLSWLRHLTGEEPEVVSAEAVVGPPEIDLRLDAELAFPDGVTGTISSSMRREDPPRAELVVEGSRGTLTVVNPLTPQFGHQIRIETGGSPAIETLTRRATYDFQLAAFARAFRTGERLPTDAADAVAQMRLVDAAYRAAGLRVRGGSTSLPPPPRKRSGSSRRRAEADGVRVGIIGCGWVFDLYPETWNRAALPIAGVADRDRARLAAVCRHYGLTPYESNEALLADPAIALVVNLTPIPAHYAVTEAALRAGKHVHTEKPVADDLPRTRELFALAKAKDLHLAGAPALIFGETARTMWKAVRDGAVGAPRLVYAEQDAGPVHRMHPERWRSRSGAPWPWAAEFESGCTLEHAGYSLSWMCALFGPVRSVTAFSDHTLPEKTEGILDPNLESAPALDPPDAADYSVASLKFESGVVGRLTCSLGAPRDHRFRVMGSRGVLSAESSRHRCPVYFEPYAGLPLQGRMRESVRRSPFLHRLYGVGGRRVPPVRDPNPGDGARPGSPAPGRRRKGAQQDKCAGITELADAIRTGRPPFPGPDFLEHLTELTLLIHGAGPESRTRMPVTSFEPLSLPTPVRYAASDWRRAMRPPLLETLAHRLRPGIRALRAASRWRKRKRHPPG